MTDLFNLGLECGCAAKLQPDRLAEILRNVRLPAGPEVLVGPGTLDDAAVVRAPGGVHLVQTVDFFPPVARGAFDYGRIAAANALSDVYAMGGRPLCALAIVCWPGSGIEQAVLEDLTRGAVSALSEAGAYLVGGHSVIDPALKYGLAVTGTLEPERMMDNLHFRPGDSLVLTKPLGTGVTLLAVKAGLADSSREKQLTDTMAALNKSASEAAVDSGIRAAVDITGFGLLGHALQAARASDVNFRLRFEEIPLLPNAVGYAEMGLLSAAAYANRPYAAADTDFSEKLSLAEQDILFDPQTSGGLLLSCPPEKSAALLVRLREETGIPSAVIGEIEKRGGSGPRIRVER